MTKLLAIKYYKLYRLTARLYVTLLKAIFVPINDQTDGRTGFLIRNSDSETRMLRLHR